MPSQWDAHAVRKITDPVVRKVRPGQHQISGFEFADKIADKISARRGNNEMEFVFRMKMPADSMEGITMRPCGEGFTTSDLDHF